MTLIEGYVVLVSPDEFRYGQDYELEIPEIIGILSPTIQTTPVTLIKEIAFGRGGFGIVGQANFEYVRDNYPTDFAFASYLDVKPTMEAAAFRSDQSPSKTVIEILKRLDKSPIRLLSPEYFDKVKDRKIQKVVEANLDDITNQVLFPFVSIIKVGYPDNVRIKDMIRSIDDWSDIAKRTAITILKGLTEHNYVCVKFNDYGGPYSGVEISTKCMQIALRRLMDEESVDVQEWFKEALQAVDEMEPPPTI